MLIQLCNLSLGVFASENNTQRVQRWNKTNTTYDDDDNDEMV